MTAAGLPSVELTVAELIRVGIQSAIGMLQSRVFAATTVAVPGIFGTIAAIFIGCSQGRFEHDRCTGTRIESSIAQLLLSARDRG